jgi:dTDP-4-amino-4,6-dideoxygalactose transaminase
VKLPHLDSWSAARKRHAERYATEFARRDIGSTVVVPAEISGCHHVWNQYTVRVKNGRRDALQKHLAEAGVQTGIHYPVPIHLQPAYSFLGHEPGDFPEAERQAARVLSLPMFPELTEKQIMHVAETIREFTEKR